MVEFKYPDGLTLTTPEDQATFDKCYAARVPLSALWRDDNNESKLVEWNAEFETLCRQRKRILDDLPANNFGKRGRERLLPQNLYKELKLNLVDGLYATQVNGDCYDFGSRHAQLYSDMVNSLLTGRKLTDLALSITYAIARGDGRVNYGDGLNLNRGGRWRAEVGNFWASDFGKYCGGKNVKTPTQQQRENALKTQSVVVPLPKPDWRYVLIANEAGFGVCMGTGTYPTTATLGVDGLACPASYSRGGHSEAYTACFNAGSGLKIYQPNSHSSKFIGDFLSNAQKQVGTWNAEADIHKQATFNYGVWSIYAGEIPII